LAVAEKLSKDRVCVRSGAAGIFKRSHIVAFRWKVSVVRDASVLATSAYPAWADC
jgi:hypothetical protein